MAVLIIQRMPPMFTTEMYDRVNAEAGIEADPPAGLLAHALGTSEGGAVMADVWESTEQFEAFCEGRLNPTMESIVGSEVFAQMPTPERDFYEVHDHFMAGA